MSLYYLHSPGGAGDYAQASTSAAAQAILQSTAAGPFTVTWWQRSSGDAAPAICAYRNAQPGPELITYYTGFLAARIEDDAGANQADVSTGAAPDGTWQHYAITYRDYSGGKVPVNGVLDIYIDGALADTVSLPFDISTDTGADVLRVFANAAGGGLAGDIRAIGIFGARYMDSAEIASIYAAGPTHDLLVDTGDYTGTPTFLWDGPAIGGRVANRGSGGSCDLVLNGAVSVLTAPGAIGGETLAHQAYVMTADGHYAGAELLTVADGTFERDILQEIIATSLFTWRRARDGDDVPDGASRMGWLLDSELGSRLWLLARAKVTAQTLIDARQYAEEALAWLVDDGVASKVAVTVERAASRGAGMSGVAIEVAVTRPRAPESRLRYDLIWS